MLSDLSIYNQLLPYNLVLLIGYFWFFVKYKKSNFLLLIVTLFFAGLFKDFGDILLNTIIFGTTRQLNIGSVIFEIGTFIWAIIIFYRYYPSNILKRHNLLVFTFIAYCVWFLVVSLIINRDGLLLSVKEIAKDIIPFLLFFVLAKTMQSSSNVNTLNVLFFRLINAQIIFSLAKLFILNDYHEGLVGSLTGLFHGGPGTSFPLLGLIFIALNSKMNLKGKDLWMIIGLLLIGFLAGKRAVWLLFPVLYLLLSIYVYRRRFFKKMIFAAILVPVFFYVGLRLVPTLNPDDKIWGSFDPEYALNYGLEYSTGKKDRADEIEMGSGRVGALVLGLEQITANTDSPKNTLFGYGINYFRVPTIKYYDSDYWWGISSRGSITGILYKFFSIGLISTVLYVLYLLLLLSNVRNKRLRNVIILLVLFDFIFYNATIITFPSLFTLLIFEMFFENSTTKKPLA
jgi:hypothetical protein